MRSACFVIPGDLSLPTGGYGYDRKVLAHAPACGLTLSHVAIPGGYPQPSGAALEDTARLIAATPRDAVLMIDGLAYGAMPSTLIRQFNRPIVALCHHPLALEPGISAADAARFLASERAAMALAAHVIVTGGITAGIVARDFGVAPGRITVAMPGTDRAARVRIAARSGTLRLLSVGSIIPRKAYDIMVAGLERLADLDWCLDIVGATQHAPETVAALHRQIQAAGLADRITLCGPLGADALEAAYQSADLFVMTSLYEGYGMAVAEAMARGLPMVAAAGGAVAETLPDGAGIKVPPGDAAAFAAAVRSLLTDPALRLAYAERSWTAGQGLPGWADSTALITNVITKVQA